MAALKSLLWCENDHIEINTIEHLDFLGGEMSSL